MNTTYNTESLSDLKTKLRNKYPQLSDSDVHYSVGNEADMLRMVAYKIGKTRQEMHEIVEKL
jgi:hypothetical protein